MPQRSRGLPHLYIVLTDPEPDTQKAACVNLTSRKANCDITVVLRPRDHPFVTHESVVWYGKAQILDMTLVEKLVQMKTGEFICKMQEPCSEALLKRVCDGLMESEDVEHGVKEYCRKRWGL